MNGLTRTVAAMPLILRLTCLAFFFIGVVLLVLCTFRFGSFSIFGDALTGNQIWSEGYGIPLIQSGVAALFAGVGIFLRWGWSRWLVVLFYLFPSPILLVYSGYHPQGNATRLCTWAIEGSIWAVFFYWYLFHRQKQYFVGD